MVSLGTGLCIHLVASERTVISTSNGLSFVSSCSLYRLPSRKGIGHGETAFVTSHDR